MIYLDNNATTQLDPAVLEEMLPFLTTDYGNPSSAYGFAARARDAIDVARERVAALVGCQPGEIVFTSGGTESSNTALSSALQMDSAAAARRDDCGGTQRDAPLLRASRAARRVGHVRRSRWRREPRAR
jgi:cysteine desulfurase